MVNPLFAAAGSNNKYVSTNIDRHGKLHITLASGKDVLAPSSNGQVGFGSPQISPDRRTVGWLVMYPYPRPGNTGYVPDPIPEALLLYRNGHVLRTFKTDQIFYDWQFWRGGSEVAYSTGPTHGGAAEVLLCDITSGKVLARWFPGTGNPPDWAKDLQY